MEKDPLYFPLPASKFWAFRKPTSHCLAALVINLWAQNFLRSLRVAWNHSCWWYCPLLYC